MLKIVRVKNMKKCLVLVILYCCSTSVAMDSKAQKELAKLKESKNKELELFHLLRSLTPNHQEVKENDQSAPTVAQEMINRAARLGVLPTIHKFAKQQEQILEKELLNLNFIKQFSK